MGTKLFLLATLLLVVSSISAQNVTWSPLNETSITSFQDLVNRFTTARNYGSEGYAEAQRFIEEWFTDLNMTFIKQTFPTFNDNITGTNLIGVLPGKMSENETHRFYLVGAHYDTMKDNPGVTDNGSGMSAVLEIARLLNLLAYYNCSMEYSIMFVGFDMSQPVPDFGDEPPCPLAAGIGPCGVFAFIDWLKDYLKQQKDAELVGTFILDSILNYNTSADSQILSDYARVLLPDYFSQVSSSGYKGNYIAGVVRAEDLMLAKTFQESWGTRPLNELYQFRQVDLVGEADPSPNVHIQLPTFFQSEHMQLWAENYSTILITDTLNERGLQQICFDKTCDTLENISEDNYEFGYQTARAVADSIFKLGNGNCFTNVTEPPTDAAGSLIPSVFTLMLVHLVGFVLLLL